MTRWFVAVAVAWATQAGAEVSRWTSSPLPSGDPNTLSATAYVAGRESPALVVLHTRLDPFTYAVHALEPIRSFDGGANWSSFRVPGGMPTELHVSPTDARTWYARVGDGYFRTRDGGDTWAALAMGLPSGHDASGIRLHAVGAEPDQLYAVRSERHFLASEVVGVLVSGDGGDTWRELDLGRAPGRFRGIAPSASDVGVAYAIYDDALLRTADGGATWILVTPPDWKGPQRVNSFALDGRDPSIAYCVLTRVVFDGPPPPLWVTRDGGATWSANELPESLIVADPLQRGRAYAFEQVYGSPRLAIPRMRVRETRDAGRSWVAVEGGINDPLAPQSGSILADGVRRTAVAASGSRWWSLRLDHGALALGSDLWWDPAEPGKGLTITQHASTNPFVVWYTYDAAGSPVWRVVPGGAWNDRTFTGPMYETIGPPYFRGAFDPGRVSMRAVGDATLRFDDENNALFAYSLIGGATVETRITRQLFAPPAMSSPDNMADLWWNASEPGWGIAISHQYNRIFATWFVYGDDGRPLWVVMPDAVLGSELAGAAARTVASGDIYTTRGPPAGAPFDPTQVVATRIGTATLHFRSTEEVALEYTAFGRTVSRAITRQPF